MKITFDVVSLEDLVHQVSQLTGQEKKNPRSSVGDEEPKTEEPKTEEPKTEEPKTEEPKTEELPAPPPWWENTKEFVKWLKGKVTDEKAMAAMNKACRAHNPPITVQELSNEERAALVREVGE